MARKKKQEGGATSEWLNTYADMVTLLLTFFILLFSMSTLDSYKFNLFVDAFRSDISSSEQIIIVAEGDGDVTEASNEGPDTSEEPMDLEDMLRQLQDYVRENGLEDSVQVVGEEDQILIRFSDDLLFEPNSARLKEADMELLDFVGNGIKSVQNEANLIAINGYTAAIPDDPNYAVSDRTLSTDRANVVLQRFEDSGIDPAKLMASGWGKHRPIAENDTEEGRSQNRRVEILISGTDYISEQLDQLYNKLV